MTRVTIGIHVYENPERLRSTIASVRENTKHVVQLVLLPDGADEQTNATLSRLNGIQQFATPDPRGGAAAFNRLASVRDVDVFVFLESGCIVAPGWLEPLLSALDDARNGLAGPTTNSSWNEQGAVLCAEDAASDVARMGRDVAIRFGHDVRTLEPLHSLADFCYAVRRDVIDAIGLADEAYGLGPCWEMDYNIRAARANFRGVWACAAYVHRGPPSARRRLEEARRFEMSKRRYQDKFCGGRLQGLKADYRSHCRGDACPNFAPPSLITIREREVVAHPPALALIQSPLAQDVRPRAEAPEPLVTCIMPTSNRRVFVRQALRCLLRQDYGNLELIVVDDGADAVNDCLPDDIRIRYLRLDRPLSIGAKRNLACSRAAGEIIVHWDDDDWYPPWRVRTQVRALIDSNAGICGTSRLFYYEPASDCAWEYRYVSTSPTWLAGNTLAYWKSVWEGHRFPDVQVGEDALFLWNSAGAVLRDLADPHLCVGMIHPGNISPKDTRGMYWHVQPVSEISAILSDDIYFYCTIPGLESAGWPLVSCIMPTYNRHALVPLAVELFGRQDYPNRELIIVDDSDRADDNFLLEVPNVRYFQCATRRTIGAKRNFACEQARGDIIAHWDDDDWYAPERLRYQVGPLLTGQADVTGLENAFVLEPASGRFWTTRQDLHRKMFLGDVHGGTLVFRKQLFTEGLRYPEVSLAEDAWLLQAALTGGKRLRRLSNPGVFVYMRHGRNAWKQCVPGRFLNPAGWERVARPTMFPATLLETYQAVMAAM